MLGLLIPISGVLAIGQMTEPIIVDNAMRGQQIIKTLNLYSSADTEKEFGLIAEGQIKDWTKFYTISDKNFENPINSILIPFDIYVNVIAVFTVPADIPNDTYIGEVSITSEPPKTESDGSSANVTQKVGRPVKISVTDEQIIAATVSVIPQSYDINPGDPLSIRLIFYNAGNIEIKPDIQVRIRDIEQTKILYNTIFPYPDSEPAIKSLARYEIPAISVPTSGLANARYWADITIKVGSQEVAQKAFRFRVGRSGIVLGASFENIKGILDKYPMAINGTFIALACIFCGVVINFMTRQQRLASNSKKGKK